MMPFDTWPNASGTPSPSPTGGTGIITSDLGIEMFLTLLAVLVFSYALGILVLHIIAAVRKSMVKRQSRREHADTDY